MKASFDVGLARRIDHTFLPKGSDGQLDLRAAVDAAKLATLVDEAKRYNFRGVCVPVVSLPYVVEMLGDSSHILPVAVIDFPGGRSASGFKASEAREAGMSGAREVDMVIRHDLLLSGRHTEVETDIRLVVHAAKESGIEAVKVILETHLLQRLAPERWRGLVRVACNIVRDAGAHCVKTSTGFTDGGATVEAVALMRETVGLDFGVKASGGIRDRATALAMMEAGASVLGCSAGVAIVTGGQGQSTY